MRTDQRPAPATIFAVAEAAGVSITTVSHVFSGKRHVSDDTRERVLQTAQRLGYLPRASARALATGRTMTIAIQHSMSGAEFVLNPFFGAMLPSMSEAAMRAGYAFLFVPPDPQVDVFVTPLIAERRVDAAILIDPVASDSFVQAVLDAGLPVASLGRVSGHPEVPGVDHDHADGCRQALDHLTERGYRRPALISIDPGMSYADAMVTTFRELAPPGSPILDAPAITETAGYELAIELLSGDERPDSIFCLNDLLAVGARRAAVDLGIELPGELGLIGVNDSPSATAGPVALTSLRTFPEQAGSRLVDLIELVLDPDAPGELVQASSAQLIPMQLIARDSTLRP